MRKENAEVLRAQTLLKRSGERAAHGDPGYRTDLSRAWFMAYRSGLLISPEIMNQVHRKYNAHRGSE